MDPILIIIFASLSQAFLSYFLLRWFNRLEPGDKFHLDKGYALFFLSISAIPFGGIFIMLIFGVIHLYKKYIKDKDSFLGFK